jgi:hypothetical protein
MIIVGKLVKLEAGNSTILVETSDIGGGEGLVRATGHMERGIDQMLERIRPFCESIIRNFEGLSNKPETASAEFGLSIAGEGNLFVVKASGEATIKVTLNWSLGNNK